MIDGSKHKNDQFRALLLASTGLTLALISSAGAQAQTAEGSPARTTDTVIVTATPIRDSIEKSIQVQRLADNIMSVVAADTIGRFPDQTAAAALSRLPATGVQRDQGQERYIQVRGAPARWTNVAFDGVNVLGAEDRIFRFDSVPASVISQLELNKTLTPEMPAEALAGRVNIRTYSPLANPGFHGTADIGRGYVDLGEGPVESLGGRLSWGGDNFGVMIGGSTFSFLQETDNYEPRFDAIGMTEVRFAKYRIKRETNALNGKIEWRINDKHSLRFTGLYSEFLDAEERNQYTFSFRTAASGTRTPTSGDLVSVPVAGLFEVGNYATKNTLFAAHGDHEFGAWRASWDAGRSEATFEQNLPLTSQSQSDPLLRPSLTFTAGEAGTPVISLYTTTRNTAGQLVRGVRTTNLDQTAFNNEVFVIFRQILDQTDNFIKGDIERNWSSFGADAEFKAGFQYNDRSLTDPGSFAALRPNGTTGTILLRPSAAALGLPWTPTSLITTRSALGEVNAGFGVNFVDNPAINNQLQAILAGLASQNNAGGTNPVPRSNPALANTVEESVLSAYVQNTWRWEKHTLLAGLRVEQAEVDSKGLATLPTGTVPLAISTSDTQVFPSLHYTYDLRDDVKLRAAFVTGSARPSFTDQRATVTINDAVGIRSVSGGNPTLTPETATGIDLSAEWYFDKAGLLSAGFFRRDLKDVLFDTTGVVGDNRFNSGGVDRSTYTYSTTLNGGDGYLQGVELTYYHPWTFLPGILSGLGFQGSVAFLDGEFDIGNGRKSAFPGTSDRVLSGALFYEKYGFSLRLSYQNRTDWLDEISPGSAASDLFWEGQSRVEFSGRYELNKNFSLYMDVNNLTNERGLRYQGTTARPYELEYFGTRYLFGVRARF